MIFRKQKLKWETFRFIVGILFISASSLFRECNGYQVRNNRFKRAEYLDPSGKYLLEWEIDWKGEKVTCNISAETKGWIGFGLANDDQPSSGADLIIGGVDGKTGQTYFSVSKKRFRL